MFSTGATFFRQPSLHVYLAVQEIQWTCLDLFKGHILWTRTRMGRLQLCNRMEHGRSHGRQNKVLEIKPFFLTQPFPRLTMKYFCFSWHPDPFSSEQGSWLERVIGDHKINFVVWGWACHLCCHCKNCQFKSWFWLWVSSISTSDSYVQ